MVSTNSEFSLTWKIYLALAKYIHTKHTGATFGGKWQIYKTVLWLFSFSSIIIYKKAFLPHSDFGSSTRSHRYSDLLKATKLMLGYGPLLLQEFLAQT